MYTRTSDGLQSLVETVWRQPFDEKQRRSGGVYAEQQDETPRREVIRLYTSRDTITQ